MAHTPPKRKRHGTGYLRLSPEGTWIAEVNHAYQRHRRRFRNEAEARAWIDATVAELRRGQQPLDTSELTEARRAMSLLPDGVTLLDAVRHYVATATPASTVTLDEALQLFLADKASSGLRPRALSSLSGQCQRLAAQMGHLPLADITTDHLTAWLDSRGHTGTTRANYRRAWANLWNWCVARGHAGANPAAAITVPRVDEALPGVLTVEQAAALMSHLEAHARVHVTAYAALCLFAGLRPQEAERIGWDAINAEHIHVGPAVAKTRQQRLVAIQPNLVDWLALTRAEGRVCPTHVRHEFRAARLAVGIEPWPQDAMRHSFATYHLAMWRDAAATAHEMGHRGTDVLYRHYRALATPEDAARFWQIRPFFVTGTP